MTRGVRGEKPSWVEWVVLWVLVAAAVAVGLLVAITGN